LGWRLTWQSWQLRCVSSRIRSAFKLRPLDTIKSGSRHGSLRSARCRNCKPRASHSFRQTVARHRLRNRLGE
jgi:hypothetical protein